MNIIRWSTALLDFIEGKKCIEGSKPENTSSHKKKALLIFIWLVV